MPLIRIKLEYDLANEDGTKSVTADMRDMRAWEREHKEAFAVDNPDLGRLSYLAWHAARREATYSGSFLEFDANCTSVSEVDESEINPTP
jgi:hypothetical protein